MKLLVNMLEITCYRKYFSNVAVTALLKLLYVAVIFLKIFQEFRNNFPKENLQKAASAALRRSLFKITILIFWEQLAKRLRFFWFMLLIAFLFWDCGFSSKSPNPSLQVNVIK